MLTQSVFENGVLAIIEKKNRCATVSFFAKTHYSANNICVIDIKHLSLKEAYGILKLCFSTPNYNNHSLYLQILKIINDVLNKRLSNTDGYIKSMESTLGAAALIRSPYYEAFLDIRIAIARDWSVLEKAKDFIFYELGIDDLRAMEPI